MNKGKKSAYELDFFETTVSIIRLNRPARDQQIAVRLTADKSGGGQAVSIGEMDAMDAQCNCACLMDEEGFCDNQPLGGEDGGRVE
jgi:hypothetical protein